MNPDRNTDEMTINALMKAGLAASAIIPIVIIAVLGVFAFGNPPSNGNTLVFVLVVAACIIAVLLGVLIINYFVQRRIKIRFLALGDVCRLYAGGDRTIRAIVTGDDEFAQLTVALNTLLDNHSGVPSPVNSNDAAALQAQIEKLLQEVSAVGDGDLRVQAEVTPDTLGVLADSFNYMIEELAKVVGHVQATAVQVTNATRNILGRSAELAHASETQVAQISHTTEAVSALAVFIQNVARNAQSSAETAQEALRNANRGQQAVRQTIEGMILIRENVQETSKKIKRLGERSNEIGEIVRIIDDIADQTNLLALNAAIQSAMAGEHGRGFAVVADEIRLLAERSTESTKRIASLVKSIQGDTYEVVVAMEDSTQRVVRGSQLADDAGHSLNSIYAAVERQAQTIEGIARAANGQATVSEAVAVAMGQISEITRQTHAGTQEAAASVRYLSELSDQLRTSVATFRLPDSSNAIMAVFPTQKSVPTLPPAETDLVPWEQNFPLLPEPRYSVPALPVHAGQLPSPNQPDFASQPSFARQPSFRGQSQFGEHPPYAGGQPQPGNQRSSGRQPSFGGQPQFGEHPPYAGGQPQPGNQSSFGRQPSFGGQQLFGEQLGFGGQSQFGEYPPYAGGQPQPGNQPTFARQPSFGGQSQFGEYPPYAGGQPQPGNQPSFGRQPSFGGQPQLGNQPSFGSQQPFGEQLGFGEQSGFGDQFNFGEFSNVDNHESFNSQQHYSGVPGSRGQSQSLYPPSKQAPATQQQNALSRQQSQPLGQSSQALALEQQWLRETQHNQSPSEQDQWPFPHNGH